MKKFPHVISFYTKNSLYQLHALCLEESCKKFEISYLLEGIDSWGSWELNCVYKPFFLLEKLEQLRKPLLWVDVDATFVRPVASLKCFKYPIAVFKDEALPWSHPSKVRSGTFYVNYTEEGKTFLKNWIEESFCQLTDPNRKEEFWDQVALRNVVKKSPRYGILPPSYLHIQGHPLDEKISPNPVIIHTPISQASKQLLFEN